MTNRSLPVMLVEINTDLYGNHYTRLVNFEGPGPQPVRYATLSHCWGSDPQGPTRTTIETAETHMKEMLWENLTETFKDAIKVASALEMPYI